MLHIICFLLIFQIFNCYGQIAEAETMREVMKYFDRADNQTLAVFDLDLVLIQPSDPAFQMPNINKHRLIAREILQSIPLDKQDLFLTFMAISTDSILVDEKSPRCLQDLMRKNIPIIGLTSNLTGVLGDISSLESRKVERLRRLGIDFSLSTPIVTKHTFDNLPVYRGYYSQYLDGILFANGDVCPKGEVLVSFLVWGRLAPKHVIFIDDRERNLQSVEAALNAYDPTITFEGIHYTGAHSYPSKEVDAETFCAKWLDLAEQAMY